MTSKPYADVVSVGYSSLPRAYWLDNSVMSVPYRVGSALRMNAVAMVRSRAMADRVP